MKNKITASAILALYILSAFLPLATISRVNAQSTGGLRQQSQQLQSDIKKNEAQADRLRGEATTLKSAIAILDADIADATNQINKTSKRIDQLTRELIQTQEELKRQKELLRANMIALYKRGDASTVELIIGSDSFSQFIDEQEYLERVKTAIQDSAKKIIELEKKIKAQRDEQKEQLAQQKSARRSLDETRDKRASLLAETRGEEARYNNIVSKLEKKRREVENQLTALILSRQQRNYGVVSGGGNIIGRVGSTGFSTGPHVHFEIRNSSGQALNPYGNMGSWPVSGSITQGFGCGAPYNWYAIKCSNGTSKHTGLDIAAPHGTPIVATKPGVIIFKGWDGAYGNKVVIKHSDGTYSVYAHMSSF